MRPSYLIQYGIPVSMFGICLFVSASPDLALWIPELVGLTAMMTLLSVFAVFAVKKGWYRCSATFILLFAAVLRIMLMFRNPELSDDLFRYLFDGLMIRDGINPYLAAPSTAIISNPEAAALVPRINHAHLTTIYPPAAQLFFACGSFAGGVSGMKFVLILMDLASCCLILGILRRLGLPDARLILYAWNPLPIMEIGASGHIDAAAVCFILLALFISLGHSSTDPNKKCSGTGMACLAGACFAGAVLVKWIPLLFFPGLMFLFPARQRWIWLCGFTLTGMFLTYPFWPHVKAGLGTLCVYLSNWEFAGFGFRTLRRITGSGPSSRLILAVFGAGAMGLIYTRAMQSPQSTSGSPKPIRMVQACYAAAMAWLLLTPTLHPWYGLYLLCFLPFAGGPAGLVLSWSVFLAYRVLIPYRLTGQWIEDDWIPLLIVSAPVLAALFSRCLSTAFTPKH